MCPPPLPVDLTSAEPLVSLQYASAQSELHTKTLRRMIARGELPAVRIGVRKPGAGRDHRPIRIRMSDLDAITEAVTISGAER